MIIIKTKLPDKSFLNWKDKKYDYVDSFQADLIDKNDNITSTDIGKAFFTSVPDWVDKLFTLRDKIVNIFGLKTSGSLRNRQDQLDKLKFEHGEQFGLFKVFYKTGNEIILGEDDKHLNFRASLFLEKQKNEQLKKKLIISTTVEFNNWFGRLYFLPVRPIHQVIVPIILKGIIKHLERR